ncbi:MAG: hypothetical protein Q9194_005228, partial [Teloschistes cf. exilis]
MLSARSSPSPPSSTTSTSTSTTTTTTSPIATISLPPFHQRTISTSFPPPLLTTLLALSPVPTPTLLAQADDDGNTALHYASAYGQLRAIRALLAAGASPGAKN